MFELSYHRDPGVLHVGTTAQRNYFVPWPAKDLQVALAATRPESSALYKSLNGEWDFRLLECPEDVEEAWVTGAETPKSFGRITVPSPWQIQGHGKHQYTNVRYAIPLDPPYPPALNETAVYRRTFTIQPDAVDKAYELWFDGVDSCYYVWLNGEFLGYSQVSHATSGFDVSGKLKAGDNQLAVVVLKYCDGTYLEDQDKLRMSGIFRDVYLLERASQHVQSFRVEFQLNENFESAEIQLAAKWSQVPDAWTVSLLNPQGETLAKAEGGKKTDELVRFTVDQPQLWSAEKPVLYKVVLESDEECIVETVALRQLAWQSGVFLLNGHKVKFRGVNRHDSDPFTGASITPEQLIADLELMKDHNINAVRTSHYPSSPWAYPIYERMGFYVICEADIETHGNNFRFESPDMKYSPPDQKTLYLNEELIGATMYDSRYKEAILDRVQACVIREQNRYCRVMWSLGNESGYGPNMEAAAKWIKTYDAATPIHYEGAVRIPRQKYLDYSALDIYSRMYPGADFCHWYANSSGNKQPMVLCEYIHAMGNGPGDIEDHWLAFYEHDALCGGFAWEWCDHAVAKQNENGEMIFLYGGDFGEHPREHDGNFCVDGLVAPDRTVKPGLLEYKQVLRPVRARLLKQESAVLALELRNHLEFSATDEFMDVAVLFSRDGEVVAQVQPALESIAAGQAAELRIDLPETLAGAQKGEISVRLVYLRKGEPVPENLAVCGVERREILGFDQFILQNFDYAADISESAAALSVKEGPRYLQCHGKDFVYTFDKVFGQFKQLEKKGQKLLTQRAEWTIWRAPTDNDRNIRLDWEEHGYDRIHANVHSCQHNLAEDGQRLTIEVEEVLAAAGLEPILTLQTTWTVGANGEIRVMTKAKKFPFAPALPRFGLQLSLDEAFAKVSYWGMGPGQSYADAHQAAFAARFEQTVASQYVDYIKPQEHGSHNGLRCLRVTQADAAKPTLRVNPAQSMSFNISGYSAAQLTAKMHNYELEPEGRTVLVLDYKQNGIGSNSCGPEVAPIYRFEDLYFDFGFSILPE
ncbi:MAG: beta-galactosidase [Clostridia bacterium]|nr:beta-galactosidase [Clostridia bacterium]